MAHGQMRKQVLVLGQPLAFVGVVHIQRCAALRHFKAMGQDVHKVCTPRTGGGRFGSNSGGATYSAIGPYSPAAMESKMARP